MRKTRLIVITALLFAGIFVLHGCKNESPSSEVLKNGGMSLWSQGENKAPDGWFLGGAAAGTVSKDTKTFKDDTAGAKVVMVSGEALAFYQDVVGYERDRGKKFNFSCWVKAAKPDSARLAVYDGETWVNSGFHSGSGQWELLALSGTISDKATTVRAHIWVKNNETVYVDGASLKVH